MESLNVKGMMNRVSKDILSSVPDLDGHADRLEVKSPRFHVGDSVVPPSLLARSEAVLDAANYVPGELAGDDRGVYVR